MKIDERRILLLIAAVQFINILDFVMVMPLGPDFAAALGIPSSKLGLVGGSYTLAAAVSGVACSFFLDRFDRRKALAIALAGLVCGTAAGGFSRGLETMLASRVLAGAFGGPATSITLAILTDVVPPERRGKALGVVMGAFSVAAVLGVPAGLWLAQIGSWHTPFFAVAALGALVCVAAVAMMPPMRLHLERLAGSQETARPFLHFLFDRTVLLALANMALVTAGSFLLIPNISAYVQFNLHYPRSRLGLLYMVGGVVSFATMRVAGALIDRRGAFLSALIGTVAFCVVVAIAFVHPIAGFPVVMVFAAFMFANSFRMIALNTLATRVPLPTERARYMSTQSAVQHLSSAIGAMVSTALLIEHADKSLGGIPAIGMATIALSLPMPLLIWAVTRRLSTQPAN